MLTILTLAEMKAELGLADTTDDALLTAWMEGLQGRFDAALNRVLLRGESVTEIHDGGPLRLYLARRAIESVISVHIAADQDWENGDSLTQADHEFILNAPLGRLIHGVGLTRWPAGDQNIRVIYTGGYVAAGTTPGAGQTAMPDAIRRAFRMQMGFEWRNRETLGVNQISQSGVSVQAGAGVMLAMSGKTLMPEVIETIATFKRMV